MNSQSDKIMSYHTTRRDSYGYTRSTCSSDYQCPGREKCCATYHSDGGGALRCRYPVGAGRYY